MMLGSAGIRAPVAPHLPLMPTAVVLGLAWPVWPLGWTQALCPCPQDHPSCQGLHLSLLHPKWVLSSEP